MKTLEYRLRKAKREYEALKQEHKELMELNWDIFYGRKEGEHDLVKEKDLLKKSVEAEKKIYQLEAKLQAKWVLTLLTFLTYIMNTVEHELMILHAKIAELEEKKRREDERRNNPIMVLENFIELKKQCVERNSYSNNLPLARKYDQEKILMIEPVLIVLKNLLERVSKLEEK